MVHCARFGRPPPADGLFSSSCQAKREEHFAPTPRCEVHYAVRTGATRGRKLKILVISGCYNQKENHENRVGIFGPYEFLFVERPQPDYPPPLIDVVLFTCWQQVECVLRDPVMRAIIRVCRVIAVAAIRQCARRMAAAQKEDQHVCKVGCGYAAQILLHTI